FGWRREICCALRSASVVATCAASAPSALSERFTSSSSTPAGICCSTSPAWRSTAARDALAEARIRSAASLRLFTAAVFLFVELQDRGRGLLDRASGDVDHRPSVRGEQPA